MKNALCDALCPRVFVAKTANYYHEVTKKS